MINANEMKLLVEEVSDMCETVEEIKGKNYQTALLGFTNVINMVNTSNAVCGAAMVSLDQSTARTLDKIQDTVLNDLLARLASILYIPLEGATQEEIDAGEDIICASLKKDAKMLLSKQKEYSHSEKKEG